ncbi:uncharacterized protein LOC107405047 isoform X1 [Ziziphus jujuba]|uniref:Biogenesis of lysosome-related organelles complex 1 subunit 7 n=2 Tax=Ziziphus jujuba TaxID=326968 RepID=A0A6P3YTZ6_ZIZJJ|nr:uncharacterized protein LOC107405047 isoform X1 [Ziziphus jujuba]
MESSHNHCESAEEFSQSVTLNSEPNANPQSSESDTSTNNAPNFNGGSDALAKGLSSMLTTVIRDFDSKAQDTVGSQERLSFALDRLSRELDQLLEDAPLPFVMQHAARISVVRKRVSSLNSVLKSIQRRLDNMDRMLFASKLRGHVMSNLSQHMEESLNHLLH